jgi:hypothetical protein
MSNRRDFKNKNTKFTGSDGIVVPNGTTSGTGPRPGMPDLGTLRYNTTTGLAEFYTATGWAGVDAPPTVSSISGTINENTNSTVTITGTGFKAGSIVYITGNAVSNVERALSTTYVNQTTLTAATAAGAVNYVGNATFGIKVLNPSGLSGTLDGAGTVDRDPIWSTASGTIATWTDFGSQSASVSASDPDGSSVAYSLASGSLPGNASLDTNTGAITSSDPTDVSSPTTYTFSINATSNTQSVSRSFNIIVNPAGDGTTSVRAGTSAAAIKTLTGTTTNGLYWVKPSGYSTAQQMYCIMDGTGGTGGWTLAMNYIPASTSAWGGHIWWGNSQWDTQDGSFNTGNDLTTNQKTSAYGYLGHSEIMFVMHNRSNTNWRGWGRYSYTAGYQNKTLYQLLSSETARNKVVTSGGRAARGGTGSGLTANDRRTDDCGIGGDLFIDGTVDGYNMGSYDLVFRAATTAYGWDANGFNDTRITTTAAAPGAGDGNLRGHSLAGFGIDHSHSGWSGRAGVSGHLSYCDGNHILGSLAENYSYGGSGSNPFSSDLACTNGWEHGVLDIAYAIFVR